MLLVLAARSSPLAPRLPPLPVVTGRKAGMAEPTTSALRVLAGSGNGRDNAEPG